MGSCKIHEPGLKFGTPQAQQRYMSARCPQDHWSRRELAIVIYRSKSRSTTGSVAKAMVNLCLPWWFSLYLTNWGPGQEADRLAKTTVC